MAPRSKRQEARESKPKPPQLIIPCVTDIKTLVNRHTGLEIHYTGLLSDILADDHCISVLKNHNTKTKTKSIPDTNTTRFKRPKLSLQNSTTTTNRTTTNSRVSRSTDRINVESKNSNSSRTTQKPSRGRSNTPQETNGQKKARSVQLKQEKQTQEDAKPGTAGSKQALVPPKRTLKPGSRKSERNTGDEEQQKRYLCKTVDDSILLTLAQLVDKYQMKDPPEEALGLCKSFAIPLPDLYLVNTETEPTSGSLL